MNEKNNPNEGEKIFTLLCSKLLKMKKWTKTIEIHKRLFDTSVCFSRTFGIIVGSLSPMSCEAKYEFLLNKIREMNKP
jgi:hypothetical protein